MLVKSVEPNKISNSQLAMFKLLLFFHILILVTIQISPSKCRVNEDTNIQSNDLLLPENRHEHLQGGDGNNNVVESDKKDKKPSIMERIGGMLMMIPLMMQVLSLPGALASIKMSLLKSLFVGKLALIVMIYNLIISLRPKAEVVVVNHQPKQPEFYDHYYSPYDDDDSGWFG